MAKSDVIRPKLPERLSGDELYAWAQIIAEESHIAQAKQRLAIQFLQTRGKIPGEYLLSNDGYIVKATDQARQDRVRVLPGRPNPASPEPLPENADSGS